MPASGAHGRGWRAGPVALRARARRRSRAAHVRPHGRPARSACAGCTPDRRERSTPRSACPRRPSSGRLTVQVTRPTRAARRARRARRRRASRRRTEFDSADDPAGRAPSATAGSASSRTELPNGRVGWIAASAGARAVPHALERRRVAEPARGRRAARGAGGAALPGRDRQLRRRRRRRAASPSPTSC